MKSKLVTFLLCFFFGGLGVHRFYLGKIGTGILWLLTHGCFGIGTLVDNIKICCNKMTDKNGQPLNEDVKNSLPWIIDAVACIVSLLLCIVIIISATIGFSIFKNNSVPNEIDITVSEEVVEEQEDIKYDLSELEKYNKKDNYEDLDEDGYDDDIDFESPKDVDDEPDYEYKNENTVFKVTAKDLIDKFKKGKNRAIIEYLDERVELSGTIIEVNKDFEKYYMEIGYEGQPVGVKIYCDMTYDESGKQDLVFDNAIEGEEITLIGEVYDVSDNGYYIDIEDFLVDIQEYEYRDYYTNIAGTAKYELEITTDMLVGTLEGDSLESAQRDYLNKQVKIIGEVSEINLNSERPYICLKNTNGDFTNMTCYIDNEVDKDGWVMHFANKYLTVGSEAELVCEIYEITEIGYSMIIKEIIV